MMKWCTLDITAASTAFMPWSGGGRGGGLKEYKRSIREGGGHEALRVISRISGIGNEDGGDFPK